MLFFPPRTLTQSDSSVQEYFREWVWEDQSVKANDKKCEIIEIKWQKWKGLKLPLPPRGGEKVLWPDSRKKRVWENNYITIIFTELLTLLFGIQQQIKASFFLVFTVAYEKESNCLDFRCFVLCFDDINNRISKQVSFFRRLMLWAPTFLAEA